MKINKKKQIEALKDLKPEKQTKSAEGKKIIFPEGYENVEIKNEIDKIEEYEKKVNRNKMIYYSSKEQLDLNI